MNVIGTLANAAYDDETLSDEEIADIRASENEIKAGRTRGLREIMKDLGDDKTIRSPRD